MSTYYPNTIQAACNVLIPSMLTIVTYEVTSRIIAAAQKRFNLNENMCAVASVASGACLGPLLGTRLDQKLFNGNVKLQKLALAINFLTLILIGASRAIKFAFEGFRSTINTSLTNLLTQDNTKKFTPLQNLNGVIQTMEQSFNRRPGRQSMLIVGDQNQTDLIVNECAGRISNNLLSDNFSSKIEKMYYVHASIINGMYPKDLEKLLDSVSDQKNAILVIDQIHLLTTDGTNDSGRYSLLESYVSRGEVTIIGTTTPAHMNKIHSWSLNEYLTTLESKPLSAEGCFQAMLAKSTKNEFTGAFPRVTLTAEALVYATLFAYHHVRKNFSIQDASALISDTVFTFQKTSDPITLDGKTFLDRWKETYRTSKLKISLASLSAESKAFFSSKGVNVDEITAMVLEFNKLKNDARLGLAELPPFLTDMNEAAREGRYAPCIGREEEINLVIRTLTQPKNKSLVFLGEPGIGKTAVFEEIARRVAAGEKDIDPIKDLTFYCVNVNALTSTGGLVGQLETKVTEMINFSKQREGKCVLVIDELHLFRGAGRYKNNDTDLLEMIKNSLSRDEIIVLGTANNYRWDPIVQEDPAINRRIRSVHMLPPTQEVCYQMLSSINNSGYYTRGYQPPFVRITDDAIKAAIVYSEYWMMDRFLPDKATVLLSTVVSYYQQEMHSSNSGNRDIGPAEIAGCLYDEIKHTLKRHATKEEFIKTVLNTELSLSKSAQVISESSDEELKSALH